MTLDTIAARPVARINGVALNAPGETLSPEALRQRACTELLRQAAQCAGLLDASDAAFTDGVTSEAASAAIEALLEQNLNVPEPSEEACRRYYAAHQCATRDDLAYWSGLPKRDCRDPDEAPVDDGPVPRRELPMFDELLLGWRDRSPTVPAKLAKQVHPGGGMIRAVTVIDGVVTASSSGG